MNREITYEDVKEYCKPRCLTIIDNELLYELTHTKIKALEQEPSGDLVNRDYLLSIANKDGAYGYVSAHEIINAPSVNPQKTGHWIEDDMTYCGVDLTNYKCDKCGEIGGSWRKGLKPDKLPKYCMNCGCRMVEPQESEDKECTKKI